MWLLTSVNNLLPWRTRHDRQTRGGNLQLWPSSSRARTQQQTEISNNGECDLATDRRYRISTSFLCCPIGDCKKELLTSCFSKRQSFQNICFPPLATKEEILFWWSVDVVGWCRVHSKLLCRCCSHIGRLWSVREESCLVVESCWRLSELCWVMNNSCQLTTTHRIK